MRETRTPIVCGHPAFFVHRLSGLITTRMPSGSLILRLDITRACYRHV